MLKYGESIQSLFPWDVPFWDPAYALFFNVVYLILTVVFIGIGLVIYKTYKDVKNDKSDDNLTHSNHSQNN